MTDSNVVAQSRPSLSSGLVAWAVSLLSFSLHFRPWQAGLLEEWEWVYAWANTGVSWFFTHPWVGRPLHLLPPAVGLAIATGQMWGIWLTSGIIAGAQVLAVVWALRPTKCPPFLAVALGGLLSLHPWWGAGLILRFVPAQFSTFLFVVWLGFILRYCTNHEAKWLWFAAIAGAAGLLAYPSTALLLIGASLLVPFSSGLPGNILLRSFGFTVFAVVASLLWSSVVVQIIYPDSYGIGTGNFSLSVALSRLYGTLWTFGWLAIAMAAILICVLAIAYRFRIISKSQATALVAAIILAPLSGLTFIFNPIHLNDPERVLHPVGLSIWLILVVVIVLCGSAIPSKVGYVFAIAVPAISAFLLIPPLRTYSHFAQLQAEFLNAISEARSYAGSNQLVVIDHGGRLGDVYTGLPGVLHDIVAVGLGPGGDVMLCTADSAIRDHPIAARYPIATTEYCSTIAGVDSAQYFGSATVGGERIEMMIITQDHT